MVAKFARPAVVMEGQTGGSQAGGNRQGTGGRRRRRAAPCGRVRWIAGERTVLARLSDHTGW